MQNRYEQWLEIQGKLTREDQRVLKEFSAFVESGEYLNPDSKYMKLAEARMNSITT